jgi:hypothetical protein
LAISLSYITPPPPCVAVLFNGTQISAVVMLLQLLHFLGAAHRPLWKGILLSFAFALFPFLGNFLNQQTNRVSPLVSVPPNPNPNPVCCDPCSDGNPPPRYESTLRSITLPLTLTLTCGGRRRTCG